MHVYTHTLITHPAPRDWLELHEGAEVDAPNCHGAAPDVDQARRAECTHTPTMRTRVLRVRVTVRRRVLRVRVRVRTQVLRVRVRVRRCIESESE